MGFLAIAIKACQGIYIQSAIPRLFKKTWDSYQNVIPHLICCQILYSYKWL